MCDEIIYPFPNFNGAATLYCWHSSWPMLVKGSLKGILKGISSSRVHIFIFIYVIYYSDFNVPIRNIYCGWNRCIICVLIVTYCFMLYQKNTSYSECNHCCLQNDLTSLYFLFGCWSIPLEWILLHHLWTLDKNGDLNVVIDKSLTI